MVKSSIGATEVPEEQFGNMAIQLVVVVVVVVVFVILVEACRPATKPLR